MKSLIKAEMIRLYKNKLFIIGNILAFLITIGFCKYFNMVRPTQSGINNFYANCVSLGIMAFSALFTALFIGEQYAGGVIRNKIIAGHKQKAIYIALMLAIFAGVVTTTACWFAGCLVAGYILEAYTVKYVLVILFASIAFAGILTAISMRVKKMGIACGITIGVFYLFFNAAVAVHAVYAWADSATATVWKIVLDIMPIGQWFATFARDGSELPLVVMLLMSVGTIVMSYLIGTIGLNKRELN